MPTLTHTHSKVSSKNYFLLHRFFLTPLVQRLLLNLLPVMVVIGLVYSVLMYNENSARIMAFVNSGVNEFLNRPENQVNGLRVIAKSKRLHFELAAMVPKDFPQDIMSFDLEELRHQVELNPAVKSAKVSIEPGGLLTISVVELPPVAIFRQPDGLTLLNEKGLTLTNAENRLDHIELPLIAGKGAHLSVAEAIQVFAKSAKFSDSIRGLNRIGERRWDIVLDRGSRILLPADDPIKAIQRLLILDKVDLLLQREFVVVDLRDPKRTLLRLASIANQNFHH